MSQKDSAGKVGGAGVLLSGLNVDEAHRALARDLSAVIEQVKSANPKDVQQVAASQIDLLVRYHLIALAQSRRSFFVALIASVVGFAFFITAVAFALTFGLAHSVIPLLSGAIVEVMAGIVFALYGRTTSQLSGFYNSLQMLQRYLLANSICESMDGEERNKARATLIQEMARPQIVADKGT